MISTTMTGPDYSEWKSRQEEILDKLRRLKKEEEIEKHVLERSMLTAGVLIQYPHQNVAGFNRLIAKAWKVYGDKMSEIQERRRILLKELNGEE